MEVVYSKKEEALATQKDLEVNEFAFKSHVTQSTNSPVKGLVEGVLFHLRPTHNNIVVQW